MPFNCLIPAGTSLERPSSPVADIVFVHGLFENGIDTLTEAATGVLWPRDLFLPQSRSCRLLTYEYDRRALLRPGNGDVDPLLTRAINFVVELVADRTLEKAYRRPIIFVCHGFGGLLVKRALAWSHSRRSKETERLRSIYVSTYAILFFGTPHQGIKHSALRFAHDAADTGLSQFMINLLADSEMLLEVTDQFAPIMKQYCLFNFWEELETEANGKRTYIVDMESAAPSIWNTEKCGIVQTHMGMIKFRTTESAGYSVVYEALARYCQSAHATVEFRWLNEKAFLEVEYRRQADEVLQPLIEPGLTQKIAGARGKGMFQSKTQFLRESIGSHHKIFAIHGTGGSGKTQFCLRYAEDNRANYRGVFWIDASTNENAELGFSKLGEAAGRGSSFAAGKYWLSQCPKPWLLILDNADDPKMELSTFFPIVGGGHIIITSRNPRVRLYATVGDMRFRGLDLKKAGATIRRKIYTLEQYLRAYLGYRDSLLPTINVKDLNAVTTWEIPFQKIQQQQSLENNDAVDLIRIIAFLHFDAMYEFFFRPFTALAEEAETSMEDYPEIIRVSFSRSEYSEARLRLALEVLTEHSLIDFESENDMSMSKRYSQHPVVHKWTQDRLTADEYLSSLRCTIKIIAGSISPYMEASGAALRRVLAPHIESCLQKLERVEPLYPSTTGSANAIERFAFVFTECGLWKRAEDLQKRVIRHRSRVLGKKHEDTIRAVSSLGQIYWNLFKPDLAIEAQRQIIGAKRWIWPSVYTFYFDPPWLPDSISYYNALSELTLALWLAGMLDLSKKFGLRAVKGLLRLLGPDDPLTLNSMFNLARTLMHLAEWDKAHSLIVPVLRKRKQFFGLSHPDTLMTRNELGMLYCACKQNLAIAERLVTSVLETRKALLGEEHAYTLWSLNDLSKILCERDKGSEAARILEPVLKIAIRTLGDKHAGTTMTKSNLSRAYVKSKRWNDAEKLLGETVNNIPKENRDWVHAISGYVYVQIQLRHFSKAEKNCREALDLITKKKLLARDNPRTVTIAEQLAQIYHATGRPSEAEALQVQYPEIDSSVTERGYRFIPARSRDPSRETRTQADDV